MREVLVFEDKYGNLHRTQEDCLQSDLRFENRITLQREVVAIMAPLCTGDPVFQTLRKGLQNGDWIQHDPKVIQKVADELKDLTMRQCPDSRKRLSQLTEEHGFVGFGNEMAFFFDRCGGDPSQDTLPLEAAGNLIGRIRKDGREFNQFYFTTCAESEIDGECQAILGECI